MTDEEKFLAGVVLDTEKGNKPGLRAVVAVLNPLARSVQGGSLMRDEGTLIRENSAERRERTGNCAWISQ